MGVSALKHSLVTPGSVLTESSDAPLPEPEEEQGCPCMLHKVLPDGIPVTGWAPDRFIAMPKDITHPALNEQVPQLSNSCVVGHPARDLIES
jgi:hypothetical protein